MKKEQQELHCKSQVFCFKKVPVKYSVNRKAKPDLIGENDYMIFTICQ